MAKDIIRPKFTAKEWNASGAFHFYGSHKPRSFIVEVLTADPIQGELLQQALDKALERLPYYRSTFVRKKGLYYYADNDLPVQVAASAEARSIGGETTNYHMFDVTYDLNKISFAMFHGLCDGLGLNRLIESTLYHYFCLKDNKAYSDEGIYTEKTPFDPAETFDVIEEKSDVDPKELKALADKEKRFRLPELKDNKGPRMFRYPVKIKTDEFLRWCKAQHASPGSALAAMVSQNIAAENKVPEGVVMAVLPVSLRKYLHADKTFKNCASALFLASHPAECESMSTGELAAKLRQDMKALMNEDRARLLISSINMITHLGKKLPGYFLKNKLMAMSETHPQDTFSLDYVGSLRTNDYSDQIKEVRYLNPDVFNGSLSVVLSETAGYFYINFNQTFDSDRYYAAFLKKLAELGIAYEALPRDSYLNPEVELPAEQRR